jgi:hypothetical protein
VWTVTCEQLAKHGVFSDVLEACAFVPAYRRVSCASIFVPILLVAIVTVNMSLSGVDTQGFRSAPRSNRRRGPLRIPEGTIPSFASQNQPTVLSHNEPDTEDIDISSQTKQPLGDSSPLCSMYTSKE